MAESFNPYRDWLGFADGQRPATYYGLFGLKPLESDEDEIGRAVARVLAKVRGIRPGDRMLQWQEIINEVSMGKACLTDPAAKAAYDAQLRGGRGAAARPPASGQGRGSAPAARGKTSGPAKQKPAPASSPTSIPPQRGGGAPARQQASGLPPSAGSPPPASGYPQGYQGHAAPGPVASQGYTGLPKADPSQAGGAWPGVPGAEAGYGNTTSGMTGAADPAAWQGQPGAGAYPSGAAPSAPDPYAAPDAVPVWVFADPVRRRRRRKSSMADLTAKLLFSVLVLVAIAAGAVVYQRYVKGRAVAHVQSTEPVKAVEKPAEPEPDPAELAARAAEELAYKKANLQKNLAEAVAALGRRDMPAARNVLAQARTNAPTAEDQKTVDKYEKLREDVQGFWRTIGEIVSKFRPSEEVTLGKTRIIIVESGGGRFSFKYGRRIFNSTIENIPAWLAIALAEASLTGDAPSKELYGAFLAVDPEGDRNRAKVLWSEAGSAGIKIDELLPSLDSLPAT